MAFNELPQQPILNKVENVTATTAQLLWSMPFHRRVIEV